MGDWEDEDAVPTLAPTVKLAASQWADEDKEDLGNVKDDWEAEDEEKPKPAAAPKPAPKAAPKKGPAGKTAAKSSAAAPVETELERKLRLQREVEQSDMRNAADLFSGLPEAATASEFNKLANVVAEKLLVHENMPEYVPFLEKLCRDLCVNQRSEDIRKVASILNVLANERHKEEKLKAQGPSKKKTPGSKKVALKADSRDDEYEDYEAEDTSARDEYDFM